MLVMKNINKIFQTADIQTHALRDFNLTVNEGDFISVTGPSGSGKTTFLNIAGLLETFTNGEFTLDGKDVGSLNDNGRSKMRNEKIGFVFQSFNLIPDLNLFDNVDVPLRYRGFNAKERKARIEANLARVGLSSRMKHLPSQLSGGQQQRVAIARALATDPRFLLADEPTGNLDSANSSLVTNLLKDLAEEFGATLIVVTHDDNVSKEFDTVIHMEDGAILNTL